MGQLFLFIVVALTVAAIIFGVSVMLGGGDPGLTPVEPDGRAVPLPSDRPLGEEDVVRARFDTAMRGYRMAQVDQALQRAAYDIGYKGELIGVLEAEVVALREGRIADADVLRRAREAAAQPTAAQPTAAQAAAAQPAAGAAAVAEPAAAQPGSIATDAGVPHAVLPDSTLPETAPAGLAQPEAAQPESAHSESAQPEAAHPESAAQLDPAQPAAARSGSAHSATAEPVVGRPAAGPAAAVADVPPGVASPPAPGAGTTAEAAESADGVPVDRR